MDDNDKGSFFFSMLLGGGFALMLLAPFYIARRYGVHVLTGFMATIMTVVAINSDAITSTFSDVSYSSHLASPEHLLQQLANFGFWKLAAILWVGTILCIVAEQLIPQLRQESKNE